MADISFAYYPGCSGSAVSKEYDKSNRAVCEVLGINLVDIPDWNCCGATAGHQTDQYLSAALCSRNYAQAEDLGLDEMVTPCPACLKNMHNAAEHLADPCYAEKVATLTKRPLTKKPSIKSVLQVILEDIGPEVVSKKVTNPLKGLKLAPYYGCLMTRPGKHMKFDDDENPTSMDILMKACGAEIVDFPFKQECCGAAAGVPDSSVTAHLGARILGMAKQCGADAVVVACPLCQMNLDMRQGQAGSYAGENFKLPVFYYTQLMGLAFGLEDKWLNFNKLIVSPKPVLKRIGKNAPKEEVGA